VLELFRVAWKTFCTANGATVLGLLFSSHVRLGLLSHAMLTLRLQGHTSRGKGRKATRKNPPWKESTILGMKDLPQPEVLT
jgi:hypothetical protein